MAVPPTRSRESTLRPVPVTMDDGCGDEAVLRSLLRRGILVESSPGRYFLDEAALARHRRIRLPAVAGAMLVLAAAAFLAARILRD